MHGVKVHGVEAHEVANRVMMEKEDSLDRRGSAGCTRRRRDDDDHGFASLVLISDIFAIAIRYRFSYLFNSFTVLSNLNFSCRPSSSLSCLSCHWSSDCETTMCFTEGKPGKQMHAMWCAWQHDVLRMERLRWWLSTYHLSIMSVLSHADEWSCASLPIMIQTT